MAYLLFKGNEYDFRISEINGGDATIIINDYKDGAEQTWAEITLPLRDCIMLKDWLSTGISKQQEVDNAKQTN